MLYICLKNKAESLDKNQGATFIVKIPLMAENKNLKDNQETAQENPTN
ncbi:hypothetical protein [Umezakia ovalisporum]|uniref:Uncharacterized protein n=2 Tax=Umezakia ovalisporum TaxID=75695 RepID=A0AA43H2G5_9CYAN|nr:hypothetical protein [Umezakia ovalisporum]MDH6057289.1 hypothetical protein [Umezakia ovalisporum FSS-43]MDH6065508.1 hypothetical protein [Umezakia ovalisporum FSS-62]MDH6068596.1 hypothetical protein [Umezakia ovalisporum APH033B]MDH6069317.1 hypothetical protein [Umezakia ovalisporum CobakiLakeA]MDH6073851.1 hypothetical protein [Umezakia ovalisporum CS-1034]